MSEQLALSLTERSTFDTYERTIAEGLQTFVAVGHALMAIRDERLYRADYATFEDYCRQRWELSRPRAYQLMQAAEVVSNVSTIVDMLPANEAQARALTRLEPDEQRTVWQHAVDTAPDGQVTAAHVANTVEQHRQQAKPRLPVPPLPKGIYNVFLADPPWAYDFSETDSRAIESHYPTMTVEELCERRDEYFQGCADDAVLFLWATAPKLKEALHVMDAWGFTYKTHAVWDKEHIGMGYWFRGQHELLLVGTRGECSPPIPEQRGSSVIREVRTAHSRKPEAAYQVIERMFPEAQRQELFAREYREGWDGWGNQYPISSTISKND